MPAARRLPNKLAGAIEDFRQRPERSPVRMMAVQNWLIQELERRGLPGALPEQTLPGAYRDKSWDVVLKRGEVPLLALSTKSVIKNIAGTVPNRLDDMLGEAANLHRHHPECALGYFMIMSHEDLRDQGGSCGKTWFERCGQRLSLASGREDITGPAEQWEQACLLSVDLGREQIRSGIWHPDLPAAAGFLNQLAETVRDRHPGL